MYMVLEFMDGGSLADVIAKNGPPQGEGEERRRSGWRGPGVLAPRPRLRLGPSAAAARLTAQRRPGGRSRMAHAAQPVPPCRKLAIMAMQMLNGLNYLHRQHHQVRRSPLAPPRRAPPPSRPAHLRAPPHHRHT